MKIEPELYGDMQSVPLVTAVTITTRPNLKAQTPFLSMTKQKPLPLRSGNQI